MKGWVRGKLINTSNQVKIEGQCPYLPADVHVEICVHMYLHTNVHMYRLRIGYN